MFVTRARAAVVAAGLMAAPWQAWAEWPWSREVHVPTASELAEAEQQWLASVQAGAGRRPASPAPTAEMFILPPRTPKLAVGDECCLMRLRPLSAATDPANPDYAELVLRLANHFIEKREYFELQREAIDEAIAEAETSGRRAKAEQLRAKQAKFVAQSREASEQVLKLLRALTTTPTQAAHKKIPEALLLTVLESARLGDTARMVDAAVRLVLEFPDSPHALGARLVLAERAFARGDMAEAAVLYDQALATATGAARVYALVQRARCDLQDSATPKAVEKLVAAIEATTAAITSDVQYAERLRMLRERAREALVRAVAAVGASPERAWPLLRRAGAGATPAEQVGPQLLERLAEVYFETGSHAASTAVYERLAALVPEDARRCEWQERVVANSLASADRAAQLREVERLAAAWVTLKEGSAKQSVKRQCRDAALTAMRGLALALHRESTSPPGVASPSER